MSRHHDAYCVWTKIVLLHIVCRASRTAPADHYDYVRKHKIDTRDGKTAALLIHAHAVLRYLTNLLLYR